MALDIKTFNACKSYREYLATKGFSDLTGFYRILAKSYGQEYLQLMSFLGSLETRYYKEEICSPFRLDLEIVVQLDDQDLVMFSLLVEQSTDMVLAKIEPEYTLGELVDRHVGYRAAASKLVKIWKILVYRLRARRYN